MSKCENCGAAGETADGSAFTCKFCGTTNTAAPKEVRVAVPMQLVQQVVQVIGTGAVVEGADMRCPLCEQRLVTARVLDVGLSGCGGCGGIWIDNASAAKIVENPDEVFADLAARAAHNAKHRRPATSTAKCPTCRIVLDRVVSHGIELDVCQQHGTWFDVGELRRLIDTLRGKPLTPGTPTADELVPCVGCGARLPAGRANLSEVGLKCDACWRAQQQDELRRADEQMGQRGVAVGGLVGAALLAGVLGAALSGSSRS